MLYRRNNELSSLNSKLETANSNSYANNNRSTHDPDKERLMKENLSLMNANYTLNTKINQYNDITNKSRNDVKIYIILTIKFKFTIVRLLNMRQLLIVYKIK